MTFRVAGILFMATFSLNCLAYEQATHAWITAQAFQTSDLSATAAGSLTKSLGLDIFDSFARDEGYFEVLTTSVNSTRIPRVSQNYERQMLVDLFGASGLSTPSERWLVYGAIREDDNPTEDPPTPRDVARGVERPLNHFYDPAFDRPLTVGSSLGETAVDWALGSANSFASPNAPEIPRLNSFTVLDARDAMFKALTLLTYDGSSYVDIASGEDSNARQQLRQRYWTTTFRALGDVLHVNQDMAQPQHTRNEPHSGGVLCFGTPCPGGHTSIYEKYMKARALNKLEFDSLAPFHKTVTISARPLPLAFYPAPAFANYRDYWSTAPGGRQSQGKGLADYSNHGFFTNAKNFGSSEYASPSSVLSDYTIESTNPERWDGTSSNTPIHVYYGTVHDAFTNADTPHVALTTYGYWDQFIEAQQRRPSYFLNRINYDAMANLLIPRAVAYSAGLINYFFRGRIEIAPPYEGVFAVADHSNSKGFTTLRANIKNVTPPFNEPDGSRLSQTMQGGTFFAVLRYHKDKKYVESLDTVVGTSPCAEYLDVVDSVDPGLSTQCRDGIEEIIVSKPIYGVSLGSEQALVKFDFSDTPIPFGITDVVLQVVYRGRMGNEADAVAVGTLDISEPTYFTYQNASDYIRLGSEVHTRNEINADSKLLDLVYPQWCVDRVKSPPKLSDSCLIPFPLDLTVSFADLVYPLASVTELPPKRFVRLVYLASADEPFNPPVAKNVQQFKIAIHVHQNHTKALMNHEGTCLPIDPYNVPARHAQLTVTSPGQGFYRVDRLDSLRGVNASYTASCVTIGDNGSAGTPDDRARAMTPLFGDQLIPYAVQIHPAYL